MAYLAIAMSAEQSFQKKRRLFSAFVLSKADQEMCAAAAASNDLLLRWFRLVPKENLHLTLHFYGDQEDAWAERVKAVFRSATADHRTERGGGGIELQFDCAGFFPDFRRPRVFWLGSKVLPPEMVELVARVNRGFKEADLQFEEAGREFFPHLTVGRLKKRESALPPKGWADRVVAPFKDNADWAFRVSIQNIGLFESHLSPKGPTYDLLGEYPL